MLRGTGGGGRFRRSLPTGVMIPGCFLRACAAAWLFAMLFCADPVGADTVELFVVQLATDQSYETTHEGFVVRLENQETWGWEVGVYRAHADENLLYPKGNWHGAFPCQVVPRAVAEQIFPDERILPVRGEPWAIVLKLTDAALDDKTAPTRFTAGRASVSWMRSSDIEKRKSETNPR